MPAGGSHFQSNIQIALFADGWSGNNRTELLAETT
jgi:hypothetical protein